MHLLLNHHLGKTSSPFFLFHAYSQVAYFDATVVATSRKVRLRGSHFQQKSTCLPESKAQLAEVPSLYWFKFDVKSFIVWISESRFLNASFDQAKVGFLQPGFKWLTTPY